MIFIMGIPPATAASNFIETPTLFEILFKSFQYLEISALFVVITCFLFLSDLKYEKRREPDRKL